MLEPACVRRTVERGIGQAMFENKNQRKKRQTPYEKWVASEGLPIIQGHYIEEVAPRERG